MRLSFVQQLEARGGETIRRGYWFLGGSESEYSMMFLTSLCDRSSEFFFRMLLPILLNCSSSRRFGPRPVA